MKGKANKKLDIIRTEVIYGGGIIPDLEIAKYVCVVGADIAYYEGRAKKKAYEILKLELALSTEKRNGLFALFENANIGNKSPFLSSARPYTHLPIISSISDSRGELLDIVARLEVADALLKKRMEEFVATKISTNGFGRDIKFREMNSGAWANQFF